MKKSKKVTKEIPDNLTVSDNFYKSDEPFHILTNSKTFVSSICSGDVTFTKLTVPESVQKEILDVFNEKCALKNLKESPIWFKNDLLIKQDKESENPTHLIKIGDAFYDGDSGTFIELVKYDQYINRFVLEWGEAGYLRYASSDQIVEYITSGQFVHLSV